MQIELLLYDNATTSVRGHFADDCRPVIDDLYINTSPLEGSSESASFCKPTDSGYCSTGGSSGGGSSGGGGGSGGGSDPCAQEGVARYYQIKGTETPWSGTNSVRTRVYVTDNTCKITYMNAGGLCTSGGSWVADSCSWAEFTQNEQDVHATIAFKLHDTVPPARSHWINAGLDVYHGGSYSVARCDRRGDLPTSGDWSCIAQPFWSD